MITSALARSIARLHDVRTAAGVVGVALDAIKSGVGCHVGAMVLLDANAESSERGVFGVNDQALEDYIVHWRSLDAVFSTVLTRAMPTHYLQVYREEEWQSGPIMRGYARPHGILHYMSSPVFGSRGRLVGVMNFCRPPRDRPFDSRDLQIAGAMSGFISATLARVEFGVPDVTGRMQDMLTCRELQVARLAALGRNNPQIALRLGIARETVKQTLRRVYRKLDVSGRAQMATTLAHRGLLAAHESAARITLGLAVRRSR